MNKLFVLYNRLRRSKREKSKKNYQPIACGYYNGCNIYSITIYSKRGGELGNVRGWCEQRQNR